MTIEPEHSRNVENSPQTRGSKDDSVHTHTGLNHISVGSSHHRLATD